jgi:hypothetical protein
MRSTVTKLQQLFADRCIDQTGVGRGPRTDEGRQLPLHTHQYPLDVPPPAPQTQLKRERQEQSELSSLDGQNSTVLLFLSSLSSCSQAPAVFREHSVCLLVRMHCFSARVHQLAYHVFWSLSRGLTGCGMSRIRRVEYCTVLFNMRSSDSCAKANGDVLGG